MRYFLISMALLPIVALPILSLADGKEDGNQKSEVATRSAASFDKRLPPVIPGETLRDNENRKIKVWSSTGPVVGQKAPDAPQAAGANSGIPEGTSIIVDQREEERHWGKK